MALQDAIAATYQTIGFVVRVNGQQVPDVLEVAVSAGFDQINANAQLTCAQRPAWAEEGAAVEVYAVINGYQALLFRGELSGVSWSFFPGTIVFDARDLLSRTRLEWGGDDRIYADQDDAAVIRNLLEAMGIPSSQANIESSGWQLGIVQEVTLASGEVPYSLIERIDSLSGYRTFSLSSGIIVRRRVDGRAAFSPAYTYTEGQNILSIRRKRTLDGIVNRADVTGLTYEGLSVSGTASAPNPYIPDPPGTISEKIQDDLIETDDRANLIAVREVADKNRRPDGFDLEVSINPLLQPGMTIAITAPSQEASNVRVLIRNIRHSIGAGGATTSIATTGGNISGYVSGFPPIASFTVDLFQEHLSLGGTAIASLIVGIADGSGSYDPDGTITTYAWSGTVYGGSISPAVSSEPVYRFAAYGGSIIGITLDVTDDDALHGTLVRDPLSLDAGSLRYEALYTAEGTIIAYSGDGQASWNEAIVPAGGTATALAPFAPPWGELWGATAGRVYVSLDGLTSALQPVGTLTSAEVSAVWVHEQDPTRVWAGLADGHIYSGVFSSAGTVATVAWSLAGLIPGGPRINELRESYAVFGELWATAGTALWRSGDSGASWSAMASGGTAWRMAAGWERNAASFLSGAAPVQYAEGGDPVFSPPITSVRGISVGWKLPELYAADDSSAAVLYLDEDFSGTATPAGTAPAQVNHLLRSGNEDRVVYMAADATGGTIGGVLKWIPEVLAPAYIRRTGNRSVRMVGYGVPVVGPIATGVEIIVPSWGGSGASDAIWYYRPASGWVALTPPVAGAYWLGVAASPLNPSHWLLLGNSQGGGAEFFDSSSGALLMRDNTHPALWLTTDSGQSWSAVTLPGAGPSHELTMQPEWSDAAANAWLLAGSYVYPSVTSAAVFWRGSGTAAVQTVLAGSGNGDARLHIPGLNGDLVLWEQPNGTTSGRPFGFVAAGATTFTETNNPSYATVPFLAPALDRMPGRDRRVVGAASSGIWASDDYRSGALSLRTADTPSSLTAATHGVYTTAGGIQRAAPFGGSGVVVDGAGVSFTRIRADRQSRQIVCARESLSRIVHYSTDGTTWLTIALPDAAITLNQAIEVINRG